MTFSNPYLRLMRLHQPVGFWLCFWPSAWAILLADAYTTHWKLLVLFLLGAVVIRAAGCIVNDMADREFDKHVERTKTRPLASGELSMKQAFIALAVLLKIGFAILVSVYFLLPSDVSFPVLLAVTVPVLALSAAYPFMKRITWWPQAFLGITFNWGVLIGWVAVRGTWEWDVLPLYAAAVFWTLGYDTVYGFQDMKDDEKIGVKSTSRRLAANTKLWIGFFYAATLALLATAVVFAPASNYLWLAGLFIMAAHFAWQVRMLDANQPATCLRIFKSNAWIGGLWLIPPILVQIT